MKVLKLNQFQFSNLLALENLRNQNRNLNKAKDLFKIVSNYNHCK